MFHDEAWSCGLVVVVVVFFQDVTSVVINRIDFSTGADAVFGKLWCVCVWLMTLAVCPCRLQRKD